MQLGSTVSLRFGQILKQVAPEVLLQHDTLTYNSAAAARANVFALGATHIGILCSRSITCRTRAATLKPACGWASDADGIQPERFSSTKLSMDTQARRVQPEPSRAYRKVVDRLVGCTQVSQAMLDIAQGLGLACGRAVRLAVAQQSRQEALGGPVQAAQPAMTPPPRPEPARPQSLFKTCLTVL